MAMRVFDAFPIEVPEPIDRKDEEGSAAEEQGYQAFQNHLISFCDEILAKEEMSESEKYRLRIDAYNVRSCFLTHENLPFGVRQAALDGMLSLLQFASNDPSLANDLANKVRAMEGGKSNAEKWKLKKDKVKKAIIEEVRSLGRNLATSEACARELEPGVKERLGLPVNHSGYPSWSVIRRYIVQIKKNKG